MTAVTAVAWLSTPEHQLSITRTRASADAADGDDLASSAVDTDVVVAAAADLIASLAWNHNERCSLALLW